MRYRPMPSRTSARRRKKPMASKTIRLIERLSRDNESGGKSKPDQDSQYCD
jgi:hypothetical protein